MDSEIALNTDPALKYSNTTVAVYLYKSNTVYQKKLKFLFDIKTKNSKMPSIHSYDTLMSHTEWSVQSFFKSNTYCVLLGDAQQFFWLYW